MQPHPCQPEVVKNAFEIATVQQLHYIVVVCNILVPVLARL